MRTKLFLILLIVLSGKLYSQIKPLYAGPLNEFYQVSYDSNSAFLNFNFGTWKQKIFGTDSFYYKNSDSSCFESYLINPSNLTFKKLFSQKVNVNHVFGVFQTKEDENYKDYYLFGNKFSTIDSDTPSPYLCVWHLDSLLNLIDRKDLYLGDSMKLISIWDVDMDKGTLITWSENFYNLSPRTVEKINFKTGTSLTQKKFNNLLGLTYRPNFFKHVKDSFYFFSDNNIFKFDSSLNYSSLYFNNDIRSETNEAVDFYFGKMIQDPISTDYFCNIQYGINGLTNMVPKIGFFRKDSLLNIKKTIASFDFSSFAQSDKLLGIHRNSFELVNKNQIIMSTIVDWNYPMRTTDSSFLHVALFDTTGNIKWSKIFSNGKIFNISDICPLGNNQFLILLGSANYGSDINAVDIQYLYLDSLGNEIPSGSDLLQIQIPLTIRDHIILFPNPATNSLTLANENLYLTGKTVSVIDLQGKVLLQSTFSPQIDIGALAPGSYIYLLQTKDDKVLSTQFQKLE